MNKEDLKERKNPNACSASNTCYLTFETDLNKDVARIATHVINDIKKHLDISAKLILEIINNSDTTRILNFIQKQLFSNLSKDTRQLQCNLNTDKCGKVLNTYKNGFKEYCGMHKYYHINDSKLILSQDELCNDHVFVQKTDDQLNDEMQQITKVAKYQLYLDTMYKHCYNLIMFFIKQNSVIENVDIFDIDKLKDYHNEIITSHYIYKDKVLYEMNGRKYVMIYRYVSTYGH